MAGSLRQLIPDDHILVRVDQVLSLSWLHDEVSDLYSPVNGRPGIDPEVAVRLMLAGLLLGLVHDRKLMREAAVNVAIRWFIGYGLHEALPDHSSLTRIRQRWGEARFRRIFERSVLACIEAGIATGEILHIDASLIRANVSWESLVERHVEIVASENGVTEAKEAARGKRKKVSTTDPDASMATTARNKRLEPSYKHHTTVDDIAGVVLDVEVTSGEVNEGNVILDRIECCERITKRDVETATADAGYAYARLRVLCRREENCGAGRAQSEPALRAGVPGGDQAD